MKFLPISVLCLCLLLGVSGAYLLQSKNLKEDVENPSEIYYHSKINHLSPEVAVTVTSVEGYDNQVVYSGFVEVHPETGASIYFVFYEALEADPATAPVLLWLQGGPGSSSWLGNLTEFGPYDLRDGKLTKREITWNSKYNLLFVDQPVGTGYSYVKSPSDYVTNQDEVATDLYTVLTNFFKTYKKYANSDFYVFGESFGGHYVPSITRRILQENESRDDNDDMKINLKGMAIGDGLTEMEIQMATYAEFAYVNGLIDKQQYNKYEQILDDAVEAIRAGDYKSGTDGFNSVVSGIATDAGDVNIYNIRVYGEYPDEISDYLNSPEVKARLNVPSFIKFKDGNSEVYNQLYENISVSMKDAVSFIVERIPVLLYNGQNDFIVNTPGAEDWIRSIKWSHQDDYIHAERKIQKTTSGDVAYYYRSAATLMQAIVPDAGHMVPMDQPEKCMELVDDFIAFSQSHQRDQRLHFEHRVYSNPSGIKFTNLSDVVDSINNEKEDDKFLGGFQSERFFPSERITSSSFDPLDPLQERSSLISQIA